MVTPELAAIIAKFSEPKVSAINHQFEETLKDGVTYLVMALPIINTPLTVAEKTILMNLAGTCELESHLVDLIKNAPTV